MSRASRRARGRQLETARSGSEIVHAVSADTRQIGALTFNAKDGSIAVNASKLEPPTQAYDADFGWIDYSAGRLSLCFAKRNLAAPNLLETRLEVRYPPEDFLQTFWYNSVQFHEKLAKYVSLWPAEAMQTIPPAPEKEAVRSHSIWASFSYISHAGSEAAIDFYHMSPAAVATFAQSKSVERLRLIPVTRVQMTTFEVFRLLERAEKLVPTLEAHVPAVHKPPTQLGKPSEEDR